MQIWHLWTDSLANLLSLIASQFGVSQAVAIILLTAFARLVLMPVSLGSAVRMQRNRQKTEQLKPELDELKRRYQDKPQELAAATAQLYRERGVTFIDRLTLLNAGTQTGFGIGILQVIRSMRLGSPFLWISNIARPDFVLTLVVCVLMSASMVLAPNASFQPSLVAMIAISCIVTLMTLATMSSAVSIYWATSNFFSIAQSLALRAFIQQRPEVARP